MLKIDKIPDVFKNPIRLDQDEAKRLSRGAEEVVSGLRCQFVSITKENIIRMQQILNDVISGEIEQTRILLNDFFRMAHDIKGQGTTFGYPILTKLATDICDILRYKEMWTHEELNRIKQDVEDMSIVMQESYETQKDICVGIEKRLKEK